MNEVEELTFPMCHGIQIIDMSYQQCVFNMLNVNINSVRS